MGIAHGVKLKNIAGLLAGAVLASVLLLAAAMWAETLVPAYKARRSRKERIAPLAAQAKELGLTYESVLAAPAKAVGKPAVWCLRRISQGETLYQGREDLPVYMESPYGMSNRSSSTHQTCTETLLTITKITALDLGTVRGMRVEASFVDYP